MSRTRVYLTVDVEGAEERVVGGRLVPAQGYDLRVWGRFENQSRDLGVGLLMTELERCGLRATFFTEVFGAHTFGFDGLREVCGEIRGRGHDVQLHTHPVQRRARYRTLGEAPAKDSVADYPRAEQAKLLAEGLALLVASGVPRGELLAYRAGHYGANNETWAAMADVGLVVSSNYNPCYFDKTCKMRFAGSAPGLFSAESGVYELPISNFVERGGGYRHLQITAVSLGEMKSHLLQARRLGIEEVTLVTHSFELCHIDSVEGRRGRVNSVNLLRLRGLAEFLRDNAADFEVETVGALAARLAAGDARPEDRSPPEMPRGRRRHKARRLFEQAYKRVEAKLPLALPVL